MGRVTLLTIARAVGVSRTTVSNAYSRPDQLTSELREKILATAAQLGYHGPHAAARMLRTGRIGTYGLVFTEDLRFVFSDPGTTEFLRGVAEATASADLGLTLLPFSKTEPVGDSALLNAPVDGYMLFSVSEDHPIIDIMTQRGVPLVIVDEPQLNEASFIGIDDRAGASQLTQHLVQLGHTKVAILAHRLDDDENAGRVSDDDVRASANRVVRQRYLGYVDGFSEAPQIIWSAGGLTVDHGRQAMLNLLAAAPDITAVACTTDQLAIGATQALRQAGKSVPGDVSVVGFDDAPRAAMWDPPLTTLRQPLAGKGRAAAELLARLIDGGANETILLPVELIIRQSTGPVRQN